MRNTLLGAFALLLAAAILPGAASAATNVNGNAVTKVVARVSADIAQGTLTYAPLAGSVININVPAGGDTIIATFTAECLLAGNTDPGSNWVEMRIVDNGTPILPTSNINTPLAFCSDKNSASHSVQVVKRLTPGAHKINVAWRIRKGNGDTLSASLDDWSFTILQAD
jgi:hypothetical protein